MDEPQYFAGAAAWRAWLDAHDTAAEVLVGFWKVGSGRASMTWAESVDEALCVGWIDGVRRRVDDQRYTIRFTPRRPGGTWSSVNVARLVELEQQGRVSPAGRAALARRRADRTGTYAYERSEPAVLAPEQQAALEADAAAWAFWTASAPSYRRVALHWVVSAKLDTTRERRFAALLADCAAGRKIAGQRRA